ncbi:T9SS type A sorting domain-containing protein [Fulvivirga ulvae]|uniref:T9SS type A sorting domain-containing protein n=1 Tax=Fulvivirga ulvae TaxID=2904245 RepID=UPI001F25EF7D|nr:T9SS type A sorting domain-containing protein [Fulvivirga ulvae]UII29643.1 T9SS type A sorting domain-containing protein [Fulvivirga ulvae]
MAVVESTSPAEGSKVSVRNRVVSISFNGAVRMINDDEINDENASSLISITAKGSNITSGYVVTMRNDSKKITITFSDLLIPDADYIIRLEPVEYNDDQASDPFTLNFSTGALVSINDLTFSNKLCAGDTANLAAITINEGFIGNFYNEGGGGAHQDIQLKLPDGLSFDISNATLSVNDGTSTDLMIDGVRFFINDSNFPGALLIGFVPNSASGASFTDIIRLTGVKVVASPNITPGDYEIKLVNVDLSYPGLFVDDVVGTVTVSGYETVSLSHDGGGFDSLVSICAGDPVTFTASEGTSPYVFYKKGSGDELETGNTYTSTTLSHEDEVYAVSSGSITECGGESNVISVVVTDSTPPVITLTDIENNTENTVGSGQTFAIPTTAVGVKLSADQVGSFSGDSLVISEDNVEFLTNKVGKKPGLYSVIFHSEDECKPDVSFTIEVYDNSRNQLLGLKNNGICYHATTLIPIGWLGEGVDGELDSISSTPNVVTGSLNPAYNGGLSSGYYIDPNMVRDTSLVGKEITFNIVYINNSGTKDTTEQTVSVQGTAQLEIILAGDIPLEDRYCENASPIRIVGNPLGTNDVIKTFSILDLSESTNINDAKPLTDLTFIFDPEQEDSSTINNLTYNNDKGYLIVYEYVSEYGCVAQITDTIQVVPLPDSLSATPVQFDYCIGDEIGFIKIDKPDTIDIAWYNSQGFLLDVADSLFPSVNTSFPEVFDFSVRPQNVDIGCMGPDTKLSIRVGEFPKANFTFLSNCSSDSKITFNSSKSQGGAAQRDKIENVYWNFHSPDTLVQTEDTLVSHIFPGGGTYEVSLVVETVLGCTDTLSQIVSVFETTNETINNEVYLETFNIGNGGWISTRDNNNANGLASNSSWQITHINNSPAWVTANDTTGVFNDNENSWVESPCFNLDLWERPKIDMDIRYFTDKFEGATLQYAISDEKNDEKWETLGEVEGGINWFNSSGVAASPGEQTIGWEGGTGEWKKARISLDDVKENAGGKPVRFRIAFASLELGNGRENNYDGFAFDNFAIRERNRMIVLEHFTNVEAESNEFENNYVDDFANARPYEVIKIEYHTSYPASDPIYLLNKADQSAHTLEYGVNEVPRTIIDGIYGVKHRNDPFSMDEWGRNEYAKRTIIDAPFNLVLSDTVIISGENTNNPGESLKIDVTITKSPTADTISSPLVLEVGVLQKSLEVNGRTYHNVLRKLLPNAAGNYIYGDWLPNDISRTETITQYWSPDFTYDAADTFLIVAYVHDTHLSKTHTKEIYQGAYKQIGIMPPTAPITGLNDGVYQGIKIYPNPSKGDAILMFDQPLIEDSPIKVYSSTGLLVYEGNITKGATSFKIPLESRPEGLYIVSFYAQGRMIRLPHILR